MASNNIVCFCSEIERFLYTPLSTLNYGTHQGSFQNIYVFLGIGDFADEQANTSIIPTVDGMRDLFKNIIVMKKIGLNDIGIVIDRNDWRENTFYDIYESDAVLSERGPDEKLIKKYYVRNKYDQVFKCLWNNINSSNTYNITNIENNDYYYSIYHNGGTLETGKYITIQKSEPSEYNGTYKIISSDFGIANVAYGTSGSYVIKTSKPYDSNNTNTTIKYAALSTEEPYFDVGTFDEEKIVYTTDGYKWKYIYTLDSTDKLKFFTEDWMPVYSTFEYPNVLASKYGYGSIDTINVIDGGSGFDNGINTLQVKITGDGEGAVAETIVTGNSLSQIIVTNPGKNYTKANVAIYNNAVLANNVDIHFTISPVGGHGFNFNREFAARNVMVVASFIEDENGNVPDDLVFNQIGIIYNPYINENPNEHANTSLISRIVTLELAPSLEPGNFFVPGEYVYQKSFESNETIYVGKVVSLDNQNNILKVINNEGNIFENYPLQGEISLANRIITTSQSSLNNMVTYTPYTGNIFYLDNKPSVERTPKGIELVKILLNYTQ